MEYRNHLSNRYNILRADFSFGVRLGDDQSFPFTRFIWRILEKTTPSASGFGAFGGGFLQGARSRTGFLLCVAQEAVGSRGPWPRGDGGRAGKYFLARGFSFKSRTRGARQRTGQGGGGGGGGGGAAGAPRCGKRSQTGINPWPVGGVLPVSLS